MPRRNRVDPWGDLHAVSARGLFTGNRGCIVDEREQVVRHHRSSTLWITCLTAFRDWRVPLARPNRWTPIFFLDDAVALAAGHRPCATCRRDMYRSFRDAVDPALCAIELDRRLTTERLRRGNVARTAADVVDVLTPPTSVRIISLVGQSPIRPPVISTRKIERGDHT